MERLRSGDLRVWYRATESLSPADVAALERTLSIVERERCARFVFWRDRRDFVAAHALLRRALSAHGPLSPEAWEFTTGPRGKPAIAGAEAAVPAFSLSHTRGLVACAVAAAAEVGIDVEPVSRSAPAAELVARCFAPTERRFLETVPREEHARRFTELWTLKEAYAKALGSGLAYPMDAFAMAVDSGNVIHLDAPDDTRQDEWRFTLAEPHTGYCLAAAVRWLVPWHGFRVAIRDASDLA